MVPDKVDNTQMEGSKPVKADTVADKEVPEATNKEDGSQTSKSTDKKPAQKHSNRASSGTQDGPVCYNRDIPIDGHKDKYPKDHISIHCVQGARRGLLMSCFGMLKEEQKMSNIFFHMDITLVDGSTLQGGKWPSVPWYPDTPETGIANQIYLGSLKFAGDSFREFVPYRTSHIQVNFTLLTTLSIEGQVIKFHYGVHMSSTPCQQSVAHVLWPLA